MLFGILSYFLVVVVVLAWICLPAFRGRIGDAAIHLGRRGRARGAAWRAAGAERWRVSRTRVRHALASAVRAAVRHRWPIATATAVLAGLPTAAVLLRAHHRADGFDAGVSHRIDERVAQLLRGEELVPPPPLPPEFFGTPEVEAWQPLARSASRQWDLLDETFRQRLLLVFKLVRERHGYEMVLIEGYRSPQRQAALAALGPSVTRAGPFESYHQHGLAADCAFVRDGRIVISEQDAWALDGYRHYGEIAKSLGLVWGGDWRSPRDWGHVEWRRPRVAPASEDNRPGRR